MAELKPCPFCGGQSFLKKLDSSYSTHPTVIKDKWKVECENKCCWTPAFSDEIYHDGSGVIVVAHNGAEEAIEAWNRRAGDGNAD